MARMKHVWRSNEAFHIYVSDNQNDYGRTREGNLSWYTSGNDRILHSYRTVICIRRKLDDGSFVFYVSRNQYSSTTSSQLYSLAKAIPASCLQFTVSVSTGRGNNVYTIDRAKLIEWRKELFAECGKAALSVLRTRSVWNSSMNRVYQPLAAWRQFCKFHKFPMSQLTSAERRVMTLLRQYTPINDLGEALRKGVESDLMECLGATKEGIAKSHERAKRDEAKRNREYNKQQENLRRLFRSEVKEERDQLLPMWRDHATNSEMENRSIFHFMALRLIDGDTRIESTMGAIIGVNEATRAWPDLCLLWLAKSRSGLDRVAVDGEMRFANGYQVRELISRECDEFGDLIGNVGDGFLPQAQAVVVGCHVIPFLEIVMIARKLGLSIPSAIDLAYPIALDSSEAADQAHQLEKFSPQVEA